MGVLDIAPTLHFVELGLKINGEEWIKVMDEYIVPNCAALMEPETWTTRHRTLAGWLVTTTRQCCTAQSSFNPRVLQISPLDNIFVERPQGTARSAASTCQFR